MLQGGPRNHQIIALAVALKEASTPKFSQYAKNIVRMPVHFVKDWSRENTISCREVQIVVLYYGMPSLLPYWQDRRLNVCLNWLV